MHETNKWILPAIVVSQFVCTSVWFAGNAVISDVIAIYKADESLLGWMTISVQLGFIAGTLVFSFASLADRYPSTTVFLCCAVLAAISNLGLLLNWDSAAVLLSTRISVGFFLAGIYPVGMKIASDHFPTGLGASLGWLVGALVLGTAFPHLLRGLDFTLDWQLVIIVSSIICVIGGVIMKVFVIGPVKRPINKIDFGDFLLAFRSSEFRAASLGYFGHMWELYTFWAFVPVMLTLNSKNLNTESSTGLTSFLVIGIGAVACVAIGKASRYFEVKKLAFVTLMLSGLCCLVSPFFFQANQLLFVMFLLFWGIVVIADSPMFSTLVAKAAPDHLRGSALTIVTCIGFAITIVSIQMMTWMLENLHPNWVWMTLAIGPLFGLLALRPARRAILP